MFHRPIFTDHSAPVFPGLTGLPAYAYFPASCPNSPSLSTITENQAKNGNPKLGHLSKNGLILGEG